MALVACRLYRLKTITCAKYPRQGTPLQSTPVQSNDYQNQNLVSLAIHYRRALAVRLQYATMHKDLKRNLSSAPPDFFRFENVFIMTIDSFVRKKYIYTCIYIYIPLSTISIFPINMKRIVTIYTKNIFSIFANLSIFLKYFKCFKGI